MPSEDSQSGLEQSLNLLPATIDKFQEAHYFLDRMLDEYHEPDPFRWNLNGFIQALRSVTFVMQKELARYPGFKEWYAGQRESMGQDTLLKAFVEGRNIVVKEGMLTHRSSAEAGLFRGRELKLGIGMDLDVRQRSSDLLLWMIENQAGFVGDLSHTAIGEQAGIKRIWTVEELGEGEVIELCHRAWVRIAKVVAEALRFAGLPIELPIPPEEGFHAHDVNAASVLLESDIDPTLPEQWGWL